MSYIYLDYFSTFTRREFTPHDKYYVNVSFLIYVWQTTPVNKKPDNPPEVKLLLYIYVIGKRLRNRAVKVTRNVLGKGSFNVWGYFCGILSSEAVVLLYRFSLSFPVNLSWPPTYIIFTLYTLKVSTVRVRSHFLLIVICTQKLNWIDPKSLRHIRRNQILQISNIQCSVVFIKKWLSL